MIGCTDLGMSVHCSTSSGVININGESAGRGGLEISAGKMSALWTTTPTSIRLDDLDVICAVLDCSPTDLLIREPEQVAARRRPAARAVGGDTANQLGTVAPRLGRNRTLPPA